MCVPITEICGNCFHPQGFLSSDLSSLVQPSSGETERGNDDNNNYISSGIVLVEPLSFISTKLVLKEIGKSQPPTHYHCDHMRASTPVSLLSSLISLHTKLLEMINKHSHGNWTNSSLVRVLKWC